MRRLTIHLKKAEKDGYGTLAYIVRNEKESQYYLSRYNGNISKHYYSNLN